MLARKIEAEGAESDNTEWQRQIHNKQLKAK